MALHWFSRGKEIRKARKPRKTRIRRLYRLEIYSFDPARASEIREFEAANWTQAMEIRDMLLNGRPYYHLQEVGTVER